MLEENFPFKALGIFSGKRGLECRVQMRPKRSTTFARKTNSSTDFTLQSNQPTPGHIAGRRDQIPGVETPKMNLSGILLCSVTSCRTVKINIQLLLAYSRILKKNSIDQTKNFRTFDRNADRNTPVLVLSFSENLKNNEDSWPMFIILIE